MRHVPNWFAGSTEYTLRLDLATADRVLEHCKLDLLQIGENEASVFALFEDPRRAALVLWHVIEPQANTHGINRQAFLSGLDGDQIEKGVEALIEALVLFFPQSKRPGLVALRKQVDAIRAMASVRIEALMQKERLSEIAKAKMDELEAKIEQVIASVERSGN